MRKKVIVVSHERSGTHFLINTIAQCFEYKNTAISLDHTKGVDWRDPRAFRNWIAQYQGRFVPNVFKSHHAYPFFAPLLDELRTEFAVFYIQRDGRDVMTSFWTFLNRLPFHGWGPRRSTVGDFMRAPPTGRITQYQFNPYPITMLERWVDQVEGWNRNGLPVHRINYESLHADHDRVVDMIAEAIDQRPVVRTRPALDDPSHLPWKGKVGSWRGYFTEADERYFHRTARPGPIGKMLPRRITRFAGKVYERLFYPAT
jgi:hypothetical protein